MSFQKWFNDNLKDSSSDIANHGADGGYSGITYYKDTTELYNKYESDIWAMLVECANNCGYANPFELMQTFNRKDMIEDYLASGRIDNSAKQLLIWFACEELSHQLDV